MEIEFAFRKESSGLFGSIGRPVARIIVIHRRRRVPQLFYVDSGADITLIPKSISNMLRPRANLIHRAAGRKRLEYWSVGVMRCGKIYKVTKHRPIGLQRIF
jgi:hypothetical protein